MSELKKIVIVLLLLPVFHTRAQQYYDDAQLWLSADLTKEVNKHFDVRFKLQGRMTNNMTELGRAYADIGVTYKVNKAVRFFGDYVFGQKRKNNGDFKTRHVLFAGIILKHEIKRWKLSYRNMLQARYVDPNSSNTGYIGYYFDRNKFEIQYEATKRMTFYAAEEINIPLNNPNVTGISISRTRSYLGTILNISKHQAVDLYFMFQAKLQQGDWFDQKDTYPNKRLKHFYVYGITYKLEF
jgi:hypothetical protein